MKLVEFTCLWTGNYSKDDEKNYNMIYGEDKSKWPDTDDEDCIVIDLERVCRFNPQNNKKFTTVELAGGYSHCIKIEYGEFKKIIEASITDQNIIKY